MHTSGKVLVEQEGTGSSQKCRSFRILESDLNKSKESLNPLKDVVTAQLFSGGARRQKTKFSCRTTGENRQL